MRVHEAACTFFLMSWNVSSSLNSKCQAVRKQQPRLGSLGRADVHGRGRADV